MWRGQCHTSLRAGVPPLRPRLRSGMVPPNKKPIPGTDDVEPALLILVCLPCLERGCLNNEKDTVPKLLQDPISLHRLTLPSFRALILSKYLFMKDTYKLQTQLRTAN